MYLNIPCTSYEYSCHLKYSKYFTTLYSPNIAVTLYSPNIAVTMT